MSLKRIRKRITDLRNERFRFRPARRIRIPKKSGGSRPRGLPNFTEKLIQEVLRMILEAYYEPRFKESSHGFRTGSGGHTALTQVHQHFQGASWLIERDIKGCDHIDHHVLLGLLAREIQDGRLFNLIRRSLDAGVLEKWGSHKTYHRTPQCDELSPLLANIYLHELDTFIEEIVLPQYTCGKKRGRSPQYRHLEYKIHDAKVRHGRQAVKRYQQECRSCPSRKTHDPNDRRLAFSGPKVEAEAIKAAMRGFLCEHLHLTLSVEKTLSTHARTEQARFLGSAINIYHVDDKLTRRATDGAKLRSITGGVRFGLPEGLIHQKTVEYKRNGNVIRDKRLTQWPDADIIDTYQQRFRGLAEDDKFAVDRCQRSSAKHSMHIALVKTLAHKRKISVSKVYQRYRGVQTVNEYEYKTLQAEVPTRKGTRTFIWGAIPLHIWTPGNTSPVETEYTMFWKSRSDLVTRLLADTCERCGSHENCQVRHVRTFVDLKRRWAGRREKPEWVKRMVALRRKTLVVCLSAIRPFMLENRFFYNVSVMFWRAV